MRGVHNSSMETISAAATAIVTAEARVQQATIQKRRWGSCWSGYWCFGSHRNAKRIGHAILAPEPIRPVTSSVPATDIPSHPPSIVLPFIAPPSSPASFLQSDPNSSTQSPAGLLSFASFTTNLHSPGPNPIFAIGPYAHETQLVSPPVFSTFTTEPSTAPFTPPPEPVHLTTPSSPEVPFAQLLSSSLDLNHRNETYRKFPQSHYEFQSYQLYPGSPVGHLISPSSVRSGTSSPFPDYEFNSSGHPFLDFQTRDVPKIWNINDFSTSKWATRQSSGSLTPDPAGHNYADNVLLESQISEVASLGNSDNGSEIIDMIINQRVSFELNAGDIATCEEKEPVAPVEATPESTMAASPNTNSFESDESLDQIKNNDETSSELLEKSSANEKEQKYSEQPSCLTSVGSVKEFKFDNTDEGNDDKSAMNSDWWSKENIVAKETGPHTNWTFFPMIQPGIS